MIRSFLLWVVLFGSLFLVFALIVLPLMLIFFVPILPIMILAFPMIFINHGTGRVHWSEKPYLWYFNNVWLKSMYKLGVIKRPIA